VADEKKYAKYIYEMPRCEPREHFEGKVNHLMIFDSIDCPENKLWFSVYEVYAPGSGQGMGDTWEIPSMAGETVTETGHFHDVPEVHLFFGSDPEHPDDLGGEVEVWLGSGEDAEKYVITKKTAIYCPPGLVHTPFYYRKVTHPPYYQIAILSAPEITAEQTGELPPGFKR